MFPYVTIAGLKVYMTGIGILVSFVAFLVFAMYFCRKYKQSFLKLFYWIPIFVLAMYMLGAYVSFVFQVGWFPGNFEELKMMLSPYGFKFHFVGVLLGFVLVMIAFFKRIMRYENKKVWLDIFFFSVALSLVPMGFFLLLGDDFVGKATSGVLGVKALHVDSQLNKFSGVYPIGLFVSIAALLVTFVIGVLRRVKKIYGYGMRGFVLLLLSLNIIFLFQQYPRYGVVSVGSVILDIKHHVSFLVIMLCFWVYYKWKRVS